MTKEKQIAAFLLNRDEGGDSMKWAADFVLNNSDAEHEGDCAKAKQPAPFTCSRCVCDQAIKDAEHIAALLRA